MIRDITLQVMQIRNNLLSIKLKPRDHEEASLYFKI